MTLDSLSVVNFKNITQASLAFSPKINCLLGDNGMGKSNLLDAIHYLSFCKSFTGATDPMLIARGEDFAMLQAAYTRRGSDEQLSVGLQRGRAKSFKRGGKEYRRLSEHIGKFPLTLVAPSDMDLVNGPGEDRRRFLDMLISQTDAAYLDALIRYNRALDQRNHLLRDGATDSNLFLALEMMMDSAAAVIVAARQTNIARLSTIFAEYYTAIAGTEELPSLTYISHQVDPATGAIRPLEQLFAERRSRDIALHHTSAGPHRDDIEMTLNGLPLRRAASQGQQKTFTIALRLAQHDFLKHAVGFSPILLLDDIFDKLDAGRVARIINVVSRPSFGQIFITDTNRKHLDEIMQAASDADFALWTVDSGNFSPSKS